MTTANARLPRYVIAALATAALLTVSIGAHGQLYRWTDDDGNVHYSDTLPADRAPDSRDIYDRAGRHLEHIDAALSEEERALKREREHQEQEARALADQQAAEQAEYDRMLRRTYAHPDEIRVARDERLTNLQSAAELAHSRIDRYEDELDRLRKEAAQMERREGGNPAPIYQRIEEIRGRIAGQQQFIQRRRADMEDIRDTFQGHAQRLRELQEQED